MPWESFPSAVKSRYNLGMAVHLLLPIIYSLIFFHRFPGWLPFVLFIVGTFLGFLLLFLDRFVHAFYLYPNTEFNTLVRELWKKGDYVGAIRALSQAEILQEKLLTRSVLFLIVYLFLTIFVITSTGSVVGIGLMLGMGLHYTYDFWRYSRNPSRFSKQYLWQLKRTLTDREIRVFVLAWTVLFTVLTIAVLI